MTDEKHPGDPASTWREDFAVTGFWVCVAIFIGSLLFAASLLP